MNIGILGSGAVGQALAQGFLKHNYQVMIGTSNQQKFEEFKSVNKIKIGTFRETAQFGEILILAVKGLAAQEVLTTVEKEIAHKIIIDATNPIADAPPKDGVLKFFTSLDDSLMERLQEAYPSTQFVKAFNSIGSAFMVNPLFAEKPTMFICGNDTSAKESVSKILEQFGFEVADMGSVIAARAIEPLCMLWCIPGFLNNEWSHAFRLLKK